MHTQVILVLFFCFLVSACNSNDSEVIVPVVITVADEFSDGEDHGWQAGFTDYPVGEDEFYELASGVRVLPESLEGQGFMLSGNNHSDDLMMYIMKPVSGLVADIVYNVAFEIGFASNAGAGCFGIGGSPGESVYVKSGAAIYQPVSAVMDSNHLRLNLDMGVQSSGGSDAVVIGNVGVSESCDGETYSTKRLANTGQSFQVLTDESGRIWLIFAIDSGFEGISTVYITDVKVVLSPNSTVF
ncbi:hypothetical protein [Oceanospirillum beijerinckii]|uniref:hypothetical protein n=1 Tax=Oceanospirillum beijerinckii TaxID=64976 RepID=UPI00041A1DE3|nr:hypothetical protein [Oceanospirillum beijerinckii]